MMLLATTVTISMLAIPFTYFVAFLLLLNAGNTIGGPTGYDFSLGLVSLLSGIISFIAATAAIL